MVGKSESGKWRSGNLWSGKRLGAKITSENQTEQIGYGAVVRAPACQTEHWGVWLPPSGLYFSFCSYYLSYTVKWSAPKQIPISGPSRLGLRESKKMYSRWCCLAQNRILKTLNRVKMSNYQTSQLSKRQSHESALFSSQISGDCSFSWAEKKQASRFSSKFIGSSFFLIRSLKRNL